MDVPEQGKWVDLKILNVYIMADSYSAYHDDFREVRLLLIENMAKLFMFLEIRIWNSSQYIEFAIICRIFEITS